MANWPAWYGLPDDAAARTAERLSHEQLALIERTIRLGLAATVVGHSRLADALRHGAWMAFELICDSCAAEEGSPHADQRRGAP